MFDTEDLPQAFLGHAEDLYRAAIVWNAEDVPARYVFATDDVDFVVFVPDGVSNGIVETLEGGWRMTRADEVPGGVVYTLCHA
jgi:hypothetical protein